MNQFKQEQSLVSSKQSSLEKAMTDFPDIVPEDGSKPEGWHLANKLYAEYDLDKVKDGQYIAAAMAATMLNKGKQANVQTIQRKLDKEVVKKSLAAGGKPVKVSETAVYDKMKAKAIAEGPNSQSWRDWQKSILKKQGIKII